MFPDSLAKWLRFFDFFFSTSVSCLKALYCEAPMAHFLWTHSLHPGTLPWYCSIFISVLCCSSHVLLQPSHHIYEIFLQDSALILSYAGGSFQLHCKFARLRADTAQTDSTQCSQVIQCILLPPSCLSKINGQKWMNEWMIISSWHRKLMHWGLLSLFSLCYSDRSKTPGKKLSWEFWVTCSVVLSAVLLT